MPSLPILLGLTLLAQLPADLQSEPLPRGALARFGTTGLRHDDAVIGLAFSPDSKYVASCGQDNLVRLWDAKTGKQVRQFEGHQKPVYDVAFSPDGKLLVSNGEEQTIRVWDVTSGKQLRKLSGHNSAHSRFAFTPDGKHLLSFEGDDKVHLWDMNKGTILRRFAGHQGKVSAIHVSPDGKTLASGGLDMTIRLWDIATAKELSKFGPLDDKLNNVHFSPDGKRLAASSDGGSVYVFDMESNKQLHQMNGHSGWVWPVVFAPDGKTLASGGADGLIIFWDPGTGQQKKKLLGHSSGVTRLAFAPDGSALASASHDETVRLWNPKTGEELSPSVRHAGPVNVAALSPDGKLLATAGDERLLHLWESATGKHIGVLAGHVNPIDAAVFTRDGKHLLSAANQEGIILWDVSSRKEVRRFETAASIGRTIAPDGKTIAAAAGLKLLRWDVATGDARPAVECPHGYINDAVWSPDGRTIAVSSSSGVDFFDVTVERWRRRPARGELPGGTGVSPVRTGETPVPPGMFEPAARRKAGTGATGNIHGLLFSADSRLLLGRADSGMLVLLETATGDQRLRLDGLHAAPATVRHLAAPDGRFAIVSLDGVLKIGEMRTGRVLAERRGLEKDIISVALSADGSRLVTGLKNRTALIWDVAELVKKQAGPPAALAQRTADDLWQSLAGTNASEAHEAIQALRTIPAAALELVRKRLQTESKADPKRIAKLVAQLDERRFQKREQAMRELEQLGPLAEKALKQAAESDGSLDAKRRIQTLLAGLGAIVLSREQVQGVRAVELLELIGTGEAKKFLENLANGPEELRVTQEARAAVARLNQRP